MPSVLRSVTGNEDAEDAVLSANQVSAQWYQHHRAACRIDSVRDVL